MTVENRSTYSLIGANLFGVAVALLFEMTLRDLMLVFWMQGVIIGVSYLVRMLKGWDVEYFTPLMFVIIYGWFHAFYLAFIVYEFRGHGDELNGEALAGLLLGGLVFAAHELYSTAGKLARDWIAKPSMGDLARTAFMRTFPMYLSMVLCLTITAGAVSLLLFAGLKIVADVAMHVAEQKLAQRSVRRAARDSHK